MRFEVKTYLITCDKCCTKVDFVQRDEYQLTPNGWRNLFMSSENLNRYIGGFYWDGKCVDLCPECLEKVNK